MNTKNMNIGLVIMASGLGKRFGGNKLMEIVDGKPLIKWIIDSTEDLFEKRIVVTRNSEIKAFCDSIGMDCIIHDFPYRSDTVRIGLGELMKTVDYCFFTPADQPLISRESVTELIREAKNHNDKIVRAAYGEMEGSPMGFPKQLFDKLMDLPEGKGGNFIAKSNSELVRYVMVKDEYELWDIDTVLDLEKIKNVLKI